MKRIANGFGTVLAVFIAVMAVLPGCPTSSGGGGDTPTPVPTPVPDLVKKGEITEYNTGAKIPVYQTTGVSDSAVATDVANVISGYASAGSSKKSALQGKVSAIHIVPTATNGYYEYKVENGKVILKIKSGLSSGEIQMSFTDFVDNDLGGLTLAQSLSREALKMAFDNASTAKETVRAAFLSTRQNVM